MIRKSAPALWSIGMCMLCLLCFVRCGQEAAVVRVAVSGIGTNVTSLTVDATLDGRSATTQGPTLMQDLQEFQIHLDPGVTGVLHIIATGIEQGGCPISQGTTDVTISAYEDYTATLALADLGDQEGCQLIINGFGEGEGTVTLSPSTVYTFSRPDPVGSACPVAKNVVTTYKTKLTFDSTAQLFAAVQDETRGGYYFAGWQDDCGGVNDCQVKIGAPIRTVTAEFEPVSVCSPQHVCWEHPRPQGASLRRVVGDNSNDVWAVGDGGVILKWGGSFWTSPRRPQTAIAFNSIWIDKTHKVVVGDQGMMMRLDGDTWGCPVSISTANLSDIWGTAADNLWAVGTQGTVLHYDGQSWSRASVPISPTILLHSISGTSANNIWAVGDSGTVLHYDGQNWNAVSSGTTKTLFGVWLSDSGTVWLVGDSGTIISISNGSATSYLTTVIAKLYGIWGSSDTDIWAIGERGTLLHYDGHQWGSLDVGTIDDLQSIWGNKYSDIWIVGANGTLLHFNGLVWLPASVSQGNQMINGMFGFYTSTNAGQSLVVTVGDQGSVLHYTGADWVSVGGLAGMTMRSLRAVWGTAYNDLWVAGDSGTALHFDGAFGTFVNAGTMADLLAMWGTSSTNVLAVGAGGVLTHWDGTKWTAATLGAAGGNTLRAMWGSAANSVWMAGDGGTLLSWDGAVATAVSSGVTTTLRALWGSGASDVWAVGDGGVILHYDGSTWSKNSQSGQISTVNLLAISGSSTSDFWVTGQDGTLLHYTGTTFSVVDSGTRNQLSAIFASPKDGAVVGGLGASVLRYPP